jgi:peptidoglycan/LPS O-acetylase OafA/YrhL
MGPNQRIASLDALRGLAALAVCWFHFTHGNPTFLPDGWLKASGRPGWLGVEVFFVISGFVIPYALHRAAYRWRHYPTFLLKRLTRLDPPYLVTLALIVFMGTLSGLKPGLGGQTYEYNGQQLLTHLGYINVFFGYKWLNPVFWTLAIEFQYYLLVGLLFPLLGSRKIPVRLAVMAALAALALLIPSDEFIFHWLFLFLLGMATFQYRVGYFGERWYWLMVVVLGIGCFRTLGGTHFAAGVTTALIIAHVNWSGGWALRSLGDISYSLYLLHVPVGCQVIDRCLPWATSTAGQLGVLALALALTLGAAILLYRIVERPAQKWSASFRYRNAPAPSPGSEPRASASALAAAR